MKRTIYFLFMLSVGLLLPENARAQTLLIDSVAAGPVFDSIIGPDNLTTSRFPSTFNLDVHQQSGRVALVWVQQDAFGTNDAWCALYDKDFVLIDTAFRLSKDEDGDQVEPYVVFNQNDPLGNSLVAAWSGTGNGTTYDIYLKKIDASANLPSAATAAADVIANDTLVHTARQMRPLLAVDHSRNELLVAWRDLDGAADGSSWAGVARRFNYSTLAALDPAFVVNTTTTGLQALNHIVYNPVADKLLTVCQSANASGSYPSKYQVTFRAFARDANDSLIGGTETIVNSNEDYNHLGPNIHLNRSTGSYIIGWHSSNLDGSGEGAYARVFDKDDTELQAQFRINITTADNQLNPMATWDETSGEVAFLYAFGSSGTQTIRYQEFDADFNAAGSEGEALINPVDSTSLGTVRFKSYFSTAYDHNRNKIYLAYNIYNSSSGNLSKGYLRRLSYPIDRPERVYARLESTLSGGYHLSQEGKLAFRFQERYSVPNADTLAYRIFDADRTDVSPATLLTKNYGRNWYILDLSGTLTDGDFYTLEVLNDKGDVFKIKFRHEE